MKEPKRPVLAHGKVRHVGDAYAAVIAETVEQARDAADAIVAEIEELPAVMDMSAALAGGPFVHDEIETNQCFDWGWIEDNRAATDAAIKNAPHVTTLELINNRLVPNAIETRASTADYDPGTGEYTLYTTSQNPHLTRLLISAFVMGIAENKLRVVSPDVGGGFGSKIRFYLMTYTKLSWTPCMYTYITCDWCCCHINSTQNQERQSYFRLVGTSRVF